MPEGSEFFIRETLYKKSIIFKSSEFSFKGFDDIKFKKWI